MNGYPPWLTSLAVNSLVKSGRWQNDILIITSHPPASFQLDSSALFSVKFAHRESMATTLGVKRMKCSLLSAPAFPELSPYGQILYLDSDIIAVREVPDVWSDMFSRGTPIALYPDAGAHIIGWCSGCDKFHSGVIAVQRGKEAEQVFETWCRHLGEGDGGGVQGGITDQAALDKALALSSSDPTIVLTLPAREILFMKDYILRLLYWLGAREDKHVFEHYTGAGQVPIG